MIHLLSDLHELASGPQGRVVVTGACLAVLLAAEPKQRAQMLRYAEQAVSLGFRAMPPEKFRFEARLAVGDKEGRTVAIYAFKPWQLRIYGGLLEIDRGLCFIGCEADGKKRDKADPKALKRAAERLAPFVRSFRERG